MASTRSSLRTRWADGAETLGAWLTLPSTAAAEIVARLDVDYVCVDLQHGLVDGSDLLQLVQAIELAGGLPIARAPWNEPGAIGRILDAGCHGVIVPMVNSVEEAAAAVAAGSYPPSGRRSWGPMLVAGRHDDYRPWADGNVTVIPMIETVEALEALDGICALDGVRAVYVGPSDLAISLGLGPSGNDGHPVFDAALARVVETCRRHGVVPGVHSDAATADRRRSQGFRMITVAADVAVLAAGMAEAVRQAQPPG
ncbi:MAG: hypothetical protein RIR49_1626 [Actinomycetota bacterium]|jgi:4-hydroxy-2-oxoheptanedioate aldolase